MLEWLEARCSDTHLQQVFWKTHQRLHLLCAACLTGSAAICISQQPFHRRCYCLHPAYCSLPPGKQECLCENAVCGLQLRIQYHSACHTGCEAPDSRTKQISVQLDPGLSDRQKSGGQNGQQHFISADPEHWCSAGLRPQPTPVLPVHTWLCSHTQLQHHRQIRWRHNGDRPDHWQQWDGPEDHQWIQPPVPWNRT